MSKDKVILKYLKSDNKPITEPAKPGDACIDIKATDYVYEVETNSITYSTGLSVEIPEGYEMEIRPRSSINKYNLVMLNSPATIDSGYRGEIKLKFRIIPNINRPNPIVYLVGDKIAQFKINKLTPFVMEEVEELSDSERGEGGFGSTGE